MPLSVSNSFKAAETADVRQVISKVQLVLGNYASSSAYGTTLTSSSDDVSGDYPKGGAIDGDRTEINVGSASGADNTVGKSSWRSNVAPDTTPQTLRLNFGQQKTINRIKLYHLTNHGLKTFKFSWSNDDSSYTDFAATSDIVSGSQTSITTTNQLDTVDFPDITCQYLKLTINHTVVAAEKANVVEWEVYRLVDISSRVKGVRVNRTRDYKLSNPLASEVEISCDNSDRFFSFSHIPSTSEIMAGYINSELQPGIGVIVKMGFSFGGNQEFAPNFVGTLDRLTIKPKSKEAILSGRDGMKNLINQVLSSNLKTSLDIRDCIKYLLNLVNVSNYEMALDTTTIVIDYFFTNAENVLDSIRSLTQAAGDAAFYFDESGIATFKDYLNSNPQQKIITTQADFETGTVLTNIDTSGVPGQIQRQWFLIDDFADTSLSSNVPWSLVQTAGGQSVVSGALKLGGTTITYSPYTTGKWRLRFKFETINSSNAVSIAFLMKSIDVFGGPTFAYYVQFKNNTMTLYKKLDSGVVETVLTSTAVTLDTSYHTVAMTRDSAGFMTVSYDATTISATDTDLTISTDFVLSSNYGNTGGSFFADFDDIYYSPNPIANLSPTNAQAVYESEVIDMTVDLLSLGIFQSTYDVPFGTSLNFYTATSTDGITFDAYVAATPGSTITSALKRYIKFKVVFNSPIDDGNHNYNLTVPRVFDVTLNWLTGVGGQRYPQNVSFTFRFDSVLLDVSQEYSDNLGGDSSVLNDISVQAAPLILIGVNTDIQWQGTVQSPPVAISGANPLSVTNGQILTYPIVLDHGMDISRMSGANPAAASITFGGGGAGSWVFSKINPTHPVLVITITGTGTITNLTVIGKAFSNDTTIAQQSAVNQASVKLYGDRQFSISNEWIINNQAALDSANRLLDRFKNPTSYISDCVVLPTLSAQLGDRVTVVDSNLDLSADYIIIGIENSFQVLMDSANIETKLLLIKILLV